MSKQKVNEVKDIPGSENMNNSVNITYEILSDDLYHKVEIQALQASCPGSNPGVRTSLYYLLSAGVAKHGQRRRT